MGLICFYNGQYAAYKTGNHADDNDDDDDGDDGDGDDSGTNKWIQSVTVVKSAR